MRKILSLLLIGFILLLGWFFLRNQKPSEPQVASTSIPEKPLPPPTQPAIAELAQHKNQVSFRRAQELAWNDVTGLLPLFRQDALHTLTNSTALIRYTSGSEVNMKENTYLIIDDSGTDKMIDRAVMREGKIEGETSNEMWILTSSALIKLKAKEKNKKAKIGIQIQEKKSLDLNLQSGTGEVLVASQEKEKDPSSPKKAREIRLVENKKISLPLKTPTEDFGHKAEATDWLETVQVIREAIQETTPAAKPTPSEEVPTPPFLEITSPAPKAVVESNSITFEGRAGPEGARLKINGKNCEVSQEARFSCPVDLDPGLNLFVLQLTTKTGKTIFQKWMITRTAK